MIHKPFLRTLIISIITVFLCSSFIPADTSPIIEKKVGVVFILDSAPFCASGGPCELSPKIDGLIPAVLEPRASPEHYINLLNYTMTDYIRKATYGVSRLTFEAILNPDRPDGWFEAPHTMEEYLITETANVVDDAANLAYSVIGADVADYDVFMVVENIQHQFGISFGCRIYLPGEYTTCPVQAGNVVIDIARFTVGENISDETFLEVVGHELGHVHGLPHVWLGPYDIVGNSDVLTHYGSWSKMHAGWLTGYQDIPLCTQESCEEQVVLDPLEVKGTLNAVRIPLIPNSTLHGFIGYYLECRQNYDYDSKIPKPGVLITWVGPVPNIEPPISAVFTHGGSPYDFSNVTLSPGETWVEPVNKISINYVSKDSVNRCTVKIKQGEITAPDMQIRMYEPGDEYNPVSGYYSRDIWVDSQQNGWDHYEDTTLSNEGGQGAPTGYGDPFWVKHENRINFKVRNIGYGIAEDVLVNVYVRQPLTVTVPGIGCEKTFDTDDELVGSVTIDELDAGEIYYGSVSWIPAVESAALITVDIEHISGEITWSNNLARETHSPNSSQLASISNSALQAYLSHFSGDKLQVSLDSTCDYDLPIWMNPFVIDEKLSPGWELQVSELQGIVSPGETNEYELRSYAPPDAKPGECADMGVMVSTRQDDILVPVEVFTFRSCAVQRATITCKAGQSVVEPGKQIMINGMLTPASGNGQVALEYTLPDGSTMIGNADLSSTGSYRHSLPVNARGKWQVKAYWSGNEMYSPAESDACVFEVKSSTPEFTLGSNANCRYGPGMDYPVLTSAAKGDVIKVEARDEEGWWLYGTVFGSKCWIAASLGELNMEIEDLPIRQAPPKPTPTVSFCETLTTKSQCMRFRDKCVWSSPSPLVTGSCKPK